MGGTCSVYREEKRYIHSFGVENLREENHLGDPGIDGRIILKWILRK
jgi:hypothetical protein